MKKLCHLVGILALAGCGFTAPESEDNSRLYESVAKEKAARAEGLRLWMGLIRKGQGCSGRVLQAGELQKTVVGNRFVDPQMVRHHSPVGPIVSRSYYPNGRLKSTVELADPNGRYWITDRKLCHRNLHGMGDVTWCLRLIQSPEGQIMEEIIDDRDPAKLRLACYPTKIEKLEDKQ